VFCREQLAQLREAAPTFRARGAQVAIVGQGDAEGMQEFCRRQQADQALVCLADPDRSAYAAFGLQKGSLGAVLGPRVLGAAVRALRHGGGLPASGQDIYQLGGAFVIDRDRTLRFAQRAASAADRTTVDALLKALPENSA
jgi:peroxiredoxin